MKKVVLASVLAGLGIASSDAFAAYGSVSMDRGYPTYQQPNYARSRQYNQPAPKPQYNNQYRSNDYRSGNSNFYAGGMLGFNMTELTENAPFTNLSYVTHTSNGEEITNYTTSYDYDMSMHFGLFAGIKLSNMPIRVEAEYLMINSDGGDENLSYVDSSGDRQAINYNITGEQTTSGFMFNAYYDFENMEGMMLAPYVGGGIGWLTIETEDANGQGVELDAMMGYNIILGAKMPMEGFSLAFDYRYLMMPEDGHNVGGVNYDIENTSHMFNAKIMFGF
jgi:hypothetical protein